MNEEIKERWVAALRSGDYQQGYRALRQSTLRGDTFCCLGVLCEIAVQDGVIQWNDEGYAVSTQDPTDASDIGLPNAVLEWAGLPVGFPEPVVSNGKHLSGLNDSRECTFNRIADLIEEDL